MSLGGKGEGDVSILSSQLIGVVQCGLGVRVSFGKGLVELVSTLNAIKTMYPIKRKIGGQCHDLKRT